MLVLRASSKVIAVRREGMVPRVDRGQVQHGAESEGQDEVPFYGRLPSSLRVPRTAQPRGI